MKRNTVFLSLLLIVVSTVVNSCKKQDQSNIPNLLTGGNWQLASLLVYHYVGDTQQSVDTLNTKCDTTQLFAFFKDKSCTYTNFDCKVQPIARGNWSLSDNKLVLSADMTCQDTTKAGSSKPFASSQIINLGDFSLVLQTGDIQNYYTSTQPRTIYRYGFIRQKATGTR